MPPKLRVDRIIEIKEKLKEEKERALETAKALLESIISDIKEIDSELHQKHNSIAITCTGGADFAVLRDHMTHLEVTRAGLVDKQERTQRTVQSLGQEYIELAKDVKMLEKLKAKAMKEIRKVQNRREQKFLDDMALRIDDTKT